LHNTDGNRFARGKETKVNESSGVTKTVSASQKELGNYSEDLGRAELQYKLAMATGSVDWIVVGGPWPEEEGGGPERAVYLFFGFFRGIFIFGFAS
jgi:hypothetical protein